MQKSKPEKPKVQRESDSENDRTRRRSNLNSDSRTRQERVIIFFICNQLGNFLSWHLTSI